MQSWNWWLVRRVIVIDGCWLLQRWWWSFFSLLWRICPIKRSLSCCGFNLVGVFVITLFSRAMFVLSWRRPCSINEGLLLGLPIQAAIISSLFYWPVWHGLHLLKLVLIVIISRLIILSIRRLHRLLLVVVFLFYDVSQWKVLLWLTGFKSLCALPASFVVCVMIGMEMFFAFDSVEVILLVYSNLRLHALSLMRLPQINASTNLFSRLWLFCIQNFLHWALLLFSEHLRRLILWLFILHVAVFISTPPHFLILVTSERLFAIIVRFGKTIGEIEQILGDLNRIKQVHLWNLSFKEVFWEKLLYFTLNYGHFKNCFTTWTHLWSYLNHDFDNLVHFGRKYAWYLRVDALEHLFVYALHVFSSKWRLESNCLIKNTSKWPDVRLVVVRLISPHLRTCVIGSSSLCVKQAFLGDLTDIHISKLGYAILVQENVGALEVTMKNLCVV